MSVIQFFSENTDFSPTYKTKLRQWIKVIVEQNNFHLHSLNYIFTSDEYLLKINQKYLNHDTLTDIITFDQSLEKNLIEADIYISIDRIKENAKILNVRFIDELHRVMIHGVLHLLGHNDKSATEKKEMRKKENHYLALRPDFK